MCAMITKEVIQEETNAEAAIRAREIEVFDAFVTRSLSIVREQETNKSITDACRLVDAALKAARREGAPNQGTTDNGVQSLIEELHTGYVKLRDAQAAMDPAKEKAAL